VTRIEDDNLVQTSLPEGILHKVLEEYTTSAPKRMAANLQLLASSKVHGSYKNAGILDVIEKKKFSTKTSHPEREGRSSLERTGSEGREEVRCSLLRKVSIMEAFQGRTLVTGKAHASTLH
jgi:hypothetical protein